MAGRYELQDLHSRGLALVGWSDSDGRCRASWSCAQGCGVHVMPCGEGAREVRAFGDGDFVRCVSRDSDSGRHDDGKPVDAQAETMLRVPSGVDGVAGACACCQRPVHRLS
jgi:hypothetical protein